MVLRAPGESVDAAVSSLALHWLGEREIRSLYRDVHRPLRPEGILVNGDFLPSHRATGATRDPGTASERDRRVEKVEVRVQAFKSKWKRWWSQLEREPSMRPAFTERDVRMPGPIPPRKSWGPKIPASLESHERGLRDAGFGETVVTWRDYDFRVAVGVKRGPPRTKATR
ncbi:MAG: methyltransferase domain-containing protein [Thermoplasmata archaeon]